MGSVCREPLSPAQRRVLLAGVIFFHLGAGYALTQAEPRLAVGDVTPMQVSFVDAPAAPPSAPQDPDIPLPEDTPPPELPKLESMIQPQPPDLPPPVFPVEAPKPPPPKPRQATPAAPASDAPPFQSASAIVPTAPKMVSVAQVGYLTPPRPIYPTSARRAGDTGVSTVKVLVDVTGRPAQVSLQASSGHSALDESALSAVRAARFRAYAEGGVPQAVWVLIPINFMLQ